MAGVVASRWGMTASVAAALTIAACGAPADLTGDAATTVVAPTTMGQDVPATTVPSSEPATPPAAPVTTNPPAEPALAALQTCSEVPDLVTPVIGNDTSGMGPDPVFMGVLQTYAAEHPDTFAGIWLDREAGGTIVLAFTDDPGPHREALAARRPSPDDVQPVQPSLPITDDRPIGEWGIAFDVVQTIYTEAELVDATSAVVGALADAGFAGVGAGSNPIKNRVTLFPGEPVTVEDARDMAVTLAAVTSVAMICLDGSIVDSPPPTIAPRTPLDVIALAGPDGTYPRDTPVECGGISFDLGALQSPMPVEQADRGLADVVATWADGPMGDLVPDEGWFVLRQDEETATLAVVVDGAMSVIGAELGRNGWIWASSGGGGDCIVRRQLPPGLGGVEWVLDPAFPAPGPEATELHVLATETSCTGGSEPGERLLGPQVVETSDAVRIAFAVIPLTGAHTCPGNPATPVTITLTAPLGDRLVLDGLAIAPLADLLGT